MIKNKNTLWIRRGIQIVFFFFVFSIVLSHFLESRGLSFPWPVVHNFHAICPFGAVETAGRLIIEGSFIPKIHESNLWVFFGVVLITLLFGSLFCGYMCPLGSVQEWVGRIGKRVFKKRYNSFSGSKIDRLLGYLRYAVLFAVLIQTTRIVSLVFMKIDPYYALFHFWTGDVFITSLIVLGAVLVLSLFVERPWCRWLCPFGALLGIIQLISPWKIRTEDNKCTSCGKCSRVCPMGIRVHSRSSVIDTRCNKCSTCLDSCPTEGALTYSLPKKPRLALKNSLITGILVLALFSAPILFAHVTDRFKTSNRPAVRHGELTIQDMKGSMTLKDVAEGFDIDEDKIFQILGIPPDTPVSTKIFDLEDIADSITVHTVKLKISEYLSEH